MKRVFVDANVLFSGAAPRSAGGRLLEQALRRVVLVTCEHAEEEARRNLSAKRPDCVAPLEALLARCEHASTALFPLAAEEHLDDGDRCVLCSAIRARCDYLVTGDKRHFGPLFGRRIEGVEPIPPAGLSELFREIPPTG